MSKSDLRFAVETENGARSGVWHVRRHGSQVYVLFDGMGGVQKFSFHTPNICRLAMTREYAERVNLPNRCLFEWKRDPTPNEGRVRLLLLAIGTNTLSTALPPPMRAYQRIPAAPKDCSTIVDICFTRLTENEARSAINLSDGKHLHRLIAYERLENDDAMVVTTWIEPVADDSLELPVSPGSKSAFGHMIVSRDDPSNSGRPIRLTTFSNPKDGEFIRVWEFGCYQLPTATQDRIS